MNKKWKQKTAKALLAALFCTTTASLSVLANTTAPVTATPATQAKESVEKTPTIDDLTNAGIVGGKVAKSDAENSVAIGKDSVITGGARDWTENKDIPTNGTAIGANAEIQNSSYNGTAVGQGASVYQNNATAIGQGARVASNATNGEGSVALGQGSFVGSGDATDTDTNGVVSVGQSGKDGFSRRLINVKDGINANDAATVGQLNAAAGDVSKLETAGIMHRVDGDREPVDNLTDAVIQNHKEISSNTSKLDDFSRSGIMAGGTDVASRTAGGNSIQLGNQSRAEGQQSVALGAYAKAYGEDTKADITTRRKNNATALGYTAIAGNYDATAVGATAKAAGENASAFGSNAQALSAGSTVIGQGALADQSENATVLGQGAQAVNASNAVVLGQGAKANAGGAVALGSDNFAYGQASTLIGIGNESHANANNSIAIGGANKVLGAYSMAFGYQASAGANPVGEQKAASNAMAFGTRTHAFADDSIAMGTDASISGAQAAGSVVIGKNSYSAAANSVALGADSQVWKEDVLKSDSMGVISVGDSDEKNGTRRIINVKDGINDTDAATYGQVKGVANTLTNLNKLAVTYTDDSHKEIKLFDTKVTNVGDITMNVDDAFSNKTNEASFKEAGLVPGISKSAFSTAIGKTSFGDPNIGKNSNQSVAIGDAAQITDNSKQSIALGYNSSVGSYFGGAERGIAIGASSNVAKKQSIAIGTEAKNNTQNAVTIGDHAVIQEGAVNSIAIGGLYRYGEEGGLGGGGNYQVEKDAKDSVVIGAAGLSQSAGATAIGTGARVSFDADHSVALGEDSEVLAEDIQATDTHGVVSVGNAHAGSDSFTRRIINVADGKLDSDAATVGQVKGLTGIDVNKSGVVQYDSSDKNSVTFAGNGGTLLSNVSDIEMNINGEQNSFVTAGLLPGIVDGDYSTAIGANASISGNSGVAVGYSASVTDFGGIAIGSQAQAIAKNAVAIGANSTADEENTFSVGSKDNTRRIINVADGKADSDAATYGQLKKLSTGLSGSGIVGGETTDVNGKPVDSAVAVGTGSSARSYGAVAMGAGATAWGNGTDPSTAIGFDATSYNKSAVALGAYSMTDADYTVSVGNDNLKRRITNVKDGENDNDAATFGQLKKVSDQVTGLNDLAVTYTDKNKTAVSFNGASLNNVGDVYFQMKGGSRGLIGSGITPGTVYAAIDGWKEGAAADTGSLAIGGGMQGSDSSAASVRGKNSIALGAGAEVDVQNAKVDPGWNAFESANGTAVGVGASVTGVQGTAIGSGSAAKANQTVAVGEQAKANAQYGTAIGQSAGVEALKGTALGQGASVGSGADNSIALGYGSAVFNSDIKESDKNGVLSIGKSGEERRIIHVAAGINDTDAVTVGQIKDWKGVDVTKGQAVQYDKDGSLNVNKENSSLKVNSEQSSISHGENSVTASASGVNITNGTNSIKVDNEGTTITGKTTVTGDLNITGNLSIGGEKIATENQIKNVAGDINGLKTTVGTDAVSVKDLNGKEVKTLTGAVNANAAKIGDTAQLKDITGKENSTLTEAAVANHQAIEANTTAIENNAKAIDSLGRGLNDLGEEVDSVGAISAALAGLHPLDYDGQSKFQLSAALGTYDGTQAAAIGGFYHANKDVLLSLGASHSFGGETKTAANVGVTVRLGQGGSDNAVTAEHSAADDKIQTLEEEVQALKAELEALKAERK